VNSNYTPTKFLQEVQKIKYKYMFLPFILVFGSAIFNYYLELIFFKYISLVGLFLYLAILLHFKINRTFTPELNESILSPIAGSIISFNQESRLIKIKKKFHQKIEIRNPSEDKHITPIFDKKVHLFISNSSLRGESIGIVIGSGSCEFKIPSDYILEVSVGDVIDAGETLFTKKPLIDKDEDDQEL